MHPYESVWMAHWMQTRCDSVSGVHNHFSLHDGKKKDNHDIKQVPMLVQTDESGRFPRLDVDVCPGKVSEFRNELRCPGGVKVESAVPRSAKEVGVVTETKQVEMRNETLAMSSINSRNFRSEWQSCPMINFNKKRETILALKKDPALNGRHMPRSQFIDNLGFCTAAAAGTSKPHFPPRVLAVDPTGANISYRQHDPTDVISHGSVQLLKRQKALEKKNLPVSRFLLDDHTGSTSNILPYGFEPRGASVQSFWCRNEEADLSSSAPVSNEYVTKTKVAHLEHKHCNYRSYSTFLVSDKKIDNQLTVRYSGSSHLGKMDRSWQLHDPLASDFRYPVSIGERGKRGTFLGSEFLSCHSGPPVITRSEELNHGYHSLHRMPTCSVHDVETQRVCTTVDSVEGIIGGPSKISQPSHHFLITKKNDVNLSEGGKKFRESAVSTKCKGNAFYELLTLPRGFGCHGKQGAKLQPLANSIDTEGNQDVRDVKTDSQGLKNESSAETDTMDMDAFQSRNSLPGVASYPSNKDVTEVQSPVKSQATIASLKGKGGSGKPETEVPDMNKEPPTFSAEAGTMDTRELSTSKTGSLDVEHLLSHVELPENPNFSPYQDSPQGLGPEIRWVKRLKLSADSIAHGTKNSKVGDASSSEKVNLVFSKIMNYSKSSSEHTLGKRFGKGHVDDETMVLLSNWESSSMDLAKEHLDLSHSWIKRWCHNHAAAQCVKPAVNVVCEPRSSKAAFDEFQRKQFPSLAAMALMGKAMRDFQPCEFKKRGSFIVWNNEGFSVHTGL